MMKVHMRRLWEDRLLLLSLAVALLVAVLMAKPQVWTLDQLRSMEQAELQLRFGLPESWGMEEAVQWYAAYVRLPELAAGNSTAVIVAAVLGSYLIGGCLVRPVITELATGTARRTIALRLFMTVMAAALCLSLLLFALTLAVYGRDCFAALGSDAGRVLLPLLGWRVFFDLAAFCPAILIAFLTREMYFSLCGGAMLAVMTTVLHLLREELWWFPNYALRHLVLGRVAMPQQLWLVLPSLGLLLVTPLVGVVVCSVMEKK